MADQLLEDFSGVSVSPTPSLLPHQVAALRFVKNIEERRIRDCPEVRGGFLSMEMGMGKTLTMLQQVFETKEGGAPTLVVCPKTAMYTWKGEIEKFFSGRLRSVVFRKDEIKVESVSRRILTGFDIVITNYDYLRSLVTKFELKDRVTVYDNNDPPRRITVNSTLDPLLGVEIGEGLLFSIRWKRIIADESHAFSNISTALATAMMTVCGDVKWCVTGTPIRNWPDDLLSQFKFLGFRGNSITKKQAFADKKLKNYMHSATYAAANVQLPTLTHTRVPIILDEKNIQCYTLFFNKACEAYDDFICGTTKFDSVLVAFLRLRQACVAPWVITPHLEKKTEKFRNDYLLAQLALQRETGGLSIWINDMKGSAGVASPKVLKVLEIINDVPAGEKVIVFSMFKRFLRLVQGEYQGESVQMDGDITGKARDDALNVFKQGDAKVMFANYKVGAESLNLTEANHIVLVEPWWCPAVVEQAKARIQRMGQTKPTFIYELCIQNVAENIEKAIVGLCDRKIKSAEYFLNGGATGRRGAGLDARAIGEILGR